MAFRQLAGVSRMLKLAKFEESPNLTLACLIGSSATTTSKPHALQNLTDQYLNEPAQQTEPELTWCPSDPPPEEFVSPHVLARQTHTEPLASWICHEGGYIDPNVYLGQSPTLGCRGMLKKETFGPLAENESVVMLPESVVITVQVAKRSLSSVLSDRTIERLNENKTMLLAMFLAMEKRKRKQSFWSIFIQNLPHEISSAWNLPANVQNRIIKTFSKSANTDGTLSRKTVNGQGAKRIDAINREFKLLRSSLQVSQKELLWAYAMVESRCYSTAGPDGVSEPMILPYLDMCNHDPSGSGPGWANLSNGDRNVCLVNTTKTPIPAGAGEIFVNYWEKEMTIAERFLRYGFI